MSSTDDGAGSEVASFSASESLSSEPVTAAALAVPEPTTLGLALCGLALAARRR